MSKGAVLFDIGSTLITGPDISPSKYIARLLGLPDEGKAQVADIIMCRDFAGPGDICRALRQHFEAGPGLEQGVEELWKLQENSAREVPGASAAVQHASNMGYSLGVVSDIWAPYYNAFEKACPDIAGLLECASLSFREGARKPAAELFLRALERLGALPQESWMVGDTYKNDLYPAMGLGLKTVWVLCRPEKEYASMAGVLRGELPRPDIILDCLGSFTRLNLRG